MCVSSASSAKTTAVKMLFYVTFPMSIYHCPGMSCILLFSVLDILILSKEMSFKVPSNKALHCPESGFKKCCGFHVPCFNVGSEENIRKKWVKSIILTAWKVPKYGVFSGRYFPAFGLNTEIYGVNLCIQPKYGKIRTRKTSIFGYFSRCDYYSLLKNTETLNS